MENKKNPLFIYREKMAEVHTPEELKAAFDESHYAVCFNYDREHERAKYAMLAEILAVNPDVMITEAELCIMTTEPVVWRKQQLLIDKNGNKETANAIAKLMAESGSIACEYRFVSKNGVKYCLPPVTNGRPAPLFKGNLLIDGDKLLLTARHMTKADRARQKASDTQAK